MARAQTAVPGGSDDTVVKLDPFAVQIVNDGDGYDATGMGTVEEEMRDEPFSNDLISAGEFSADPDTIELETELSAVAEPSVADRIAGEERLNLRGFPTPAQRNGFIQIGIPETLNASQTIVIQGPLVPVLGRAAPGGIQNFLTARPQSRGQSRVQLSASSLNRRRVAYEITGPLVPKKAWKRLAVEWQRRTGPEEFAREETWLASGALTWRHSAAASTMLSLDYRDTTANASPGIPEYRETATGRIVGPYLPLALFNASGPKADIVRRSAVAGLQFDTVPMKGLALRASLEGWWRTIEQDRFTTSQLNLDTGLFSGTREPRHLEQPQQAFAAQLEATLRFQRFGAEHKFLISGNQTLGEYVREERALSVADRNALPESVRRFDPYAPDYFSPDYSPELYSRVLNDRFERGRYTSVEASDRMAFRRGLLVLTTGVRFDEVGQRVENRLPGAPVPWTRDSTAQLSYHAGLNYQLRPGRLLLFASTSTAFDPSTPVDARTGRIQDNETTLGYETGLKGRAREGRLDFSASGVLLYNRNIARRNPLYNDPIADANQTQPQLVASGEERFGGGRFEIKWKAADTLYFNLKGSYVRAITTASPDLPQEVGRPITRLPAYNVTASVRRRSTDPKGGLTWGAGWQYLDGYVASYEDSRREFLAYPGYGLMSLNAGYQWRIGPRQIDLDASVRNVLGRDLLASHARTNADRELTVSARLAF